MPQETITYKPGKAVVIYTAAAGLVVWFALLLQFSVSVPDLLKAGYSPLGAVIQILSFFTIQSNLLTGICLWALLLKPSSTLHRFFSKEYVVGGICLYMIVVGLVYHIILRSLWQPTGLLKIADELLHSADPLLFVVYWLLSGRDKLKWTQSINWLAFPFLYLVYTLIRGSITKRYPYPFVDVAKLGYSHVLINSAVLLVVFLVLGLLLIAVTRYRYKKQKPGS